MTPLPEWRPLRSLVGATIFIGLLGLTLTPLYLYVEPVNRPMVVRLGASAVVGIVLLRLRRAVRARVESQGASSFDRALYREAPEPQYAPRFLKLRDQLRFSAANQRYFADLLWPWVCTFYARHTGRPAEELTMPPGRLLRRGPSLTTLEKVIADIEERS